MYIDRTRDFDAAVLNISPSYKLKEQRKQTTLPCGVMVRFVQSLQKSMDDIELLIQDAQLSRGELTANSLRTKGEQDEFLCKVKQLLIHCEGTLRGSTSKIQTTLSPDYTVHQNNLLCYVRVKMKQIKQSVKDLVTFWKEEREEQAELAVTSSLNIDHKVLHSLEQDDHYHDETLRSKEVKKFEKGNSLLYSLFEDQTTEAQQVESTTTEIAEAVTFFTENVNEQAEVIGNIYSNVEESLNLVLEGNEQLKQAQERGAGTQATILIVMGVLTFSVLFLDWFHP